MKKYEIGIYEKAIPESYAMESMLEFAKDVGYDFLKLVLTEQNSGLTDYTTIILFGK